MKKLLILCIGLVYFSTSFAQKNPEATEVWEPVPRIVTTGEPTTTNAPSDAIVLFDGKNFDQWVSASDNTNVKWKLEGDHMTVTANTGPIKTKKVFGDVQLHLEFRTPAVVKGEGQGRGNREYMRYRCWIIMKIKLIPMASVGRFINNLSLWSMSAKSQANGNLMISFLLLPNLMLMGSK
jgi:hypothetical protein